MKLRNSLLFCAALGLAMTAYADEQKAPAQAQKPVVAQAAQATAKAVPADKIAKKAAKKTVKVETVTQLNIDALNSAAPADLEKATSKKVADKIVAARTKVGGKFTDLDQFNKEAKVGKKMLKNLAKAFPKADVQAPATK